MNLSFLEKKLKVNFKNKDLLIKSLIHKSFDSKNNNEKLEFLGDRILGFIIAKKLLELYPTDKEGTLDKKLASLVNKKMCLQVCKLFEIEKFAGKMSILGNGVDIVDNLRIKKSIKNSNFIKRIYSNDEIRASKKVKNKTNFFAKRFAAKEAFVKSLGIGFRNDINFKDISVKNNNLGKPKLYINKKIKLLLSNKLKNKKYKIHLSLSDENRHSIAFVIINKI